MRPYPGGAQPPASIITFKQISIYMLMHPQVTSQSTSDMRLPEHEIGEHKQKNKDESTA